jgi:hypothetical protein
MHYIERNTGLALERLGSQKWKNREERELSPKS